MTAPILKLTMVRKILDRPFKEDFGLSPRQIEALELALRGMRTSLMAAEMNLSAGTVKAHMFKALGKLGISKSELGWCVIKRLKEVMK